MRRTQVRVDRALLRRGTVVLQGKADRDPVAFLHDIGLPGLTGWEVAKRLRETFGRRIGLIALTSLQSAADRARSLQAGFDVHLVKPATGEDLSRAIHTVSAA